MVVEAGEAFGFTVTGLSGTDHQFREPALCSGLPFMNVLVIKPPSRPRNGYITTTLGRTCERSFTGLEPSSEESPRRKSLPEKYFYSGVAYFS